MIIKGRVTGVQPYGAFVLLEENIQGLVHISEVKHGYIKNIEEVLSVHDEVEVQIIDIDEYSQKISLSIRSLENKVSVQANLKKKYFTNRKKKIGFESLAQNMPIWVNESLDLLMEK